MVTTRPCNPKTSIGHSTPLPIRWSTCHWFSLTVIYIYLYIYIFRYFYIFIFIYLYYMHIYMIDIYMLYIYIKCIFLSLCCLLWRQWDGTACVVSGNSTEIVCGCCSSNFHSLLVKKRFGVGGKIAVVLLFFGTELIWINNSLCVFLLQWRLSIFSWPAESLSITFFVDRWACLTF